MTDGRGPQRLTRASLTAAELECLSGAYEVTRRIPILAAQRVAEQLGRDDLEPQQVAALVGKATRLCSMVRRDLVRFLPPDSEPRRSDLEAAILADALAPGVDLADRVRALEVLRSLPSVPDASDMPCLDEHDPWQCAEVSESDSETTDGELAQ